jgi:hypothetical protein
MTVTPNVQTKASPRWLRMVTGVLLFPGLWLGAMFAFGSAMPLVSQAMLLAPATLFAAVVAWLAVRRASTRLLAPFAAVVLAAYVGAAVWLTTMLNQSQIWERSVAQPPPQTAEIPDLPTQREPRRPAQTAEIPSPAPPPSPVPATPVPPPPASGRGVEPIPQFPWPPPQASATYVLPADMLERGRMIGQVVTTIITALERKGYVERSFFTTPADGVVLVTRLERINDDGSSAADADRWPVVGATARSSSLAQFLRGLFYVDPGRYRVIVFVLQDNPFRQSSEQIGGQQAREWLRTGANVLPRELAERAYAGDCTVLVYEFASDGTAVRVVESRLTGRQHLEKAGVLATLSRPN